MLRYELQNFFMFFALIPEAMTFAVFVLSILCITAGSSPNHLQSYSVLSLNVTGLKEAYQANKSEILPIHDFYNVHLSTHCAGYYHDGFNPPMINVGCSRQSGASNFLPADLIMADLRAAHSNVTLHSLNFPAEVQTAFTTFSSNLQLQVSYGFFIASLIFTGSALLWGFICMAIGVAGICTPIFTSCASLCLFIGAVILTVVQSRTTAVINYYGQGALNGVGDGVGISAGYGSGLITLAWVAFVLSFLSTAAWSMAGLATLALAMSLEF